MNLFDKNSAFNPRDELKFDPLSPILGERIPHSALERTGIDPPTRTGTPALSRSIPLSAIERWSEDLTRIVDEIRVESNVDTRPGMSIRAAHFVDSRMDDLTALRDQIESYVRG